MPSIRVLFSGEEIMTTNLEQDVYVLGRQDGCDIKIDNLGVSRNHTRIIRDGDGWAAEDLGSANGTFVNGNQITKHKLGEGDVISISKYEVFYTEAGIDGSAAPAVSKSSGSDLGFEDNLNTMAMDGAQLKKKFEEMNLAKQKGNSKPTPTVQEGGSSVEVRARQAEIEMLKKELRNTRILITCLFVGAVAAIIAVILLKG